MKEIFKLLSKANMIILLLCLFLPGCNWNIFSKNKTCDGAYIIIISQDEVIEKSRYEIDKKL